MNFELHYFVCTVSIISMDDRSRTISIETQFALIKQSVGWY